jgi:uncharacterized protein (DUF58 family)
MNNEPLPQNSSELLRKYAHALDRLEIVSRTAGAIVAAGRRPGGATGNSVDFADYRKYHYGDDVRSVDWSIYARLKKLFLRQYRAEADLAVHLLLDTSNSMSFGNLPKLEFARTLATVFAYVGLSRQDRVGVATFAGDLVHFLPPQRGKQQLFYLLRLLDSVQPGGASDFERSFKSYAARAATRGLLVVLSDCFCRGGYETALRCLAFAGFEVVVARVLADEELDPEIDDEVELQDIEQEDKRGSVVGSAAVGPYREAMATYSETLASFCLHEGFPYVETTSSLSFEELTIRLLRAGIMAQ